MYPGADRWGTSEGRRDDEDERWYKPDPGGSGYEVEGKRIDNMD